MSSELRLAQRDASWWSRPNVSPALIKQLHVIADDGTTSACNSNMILDTDSWWTLEEAHEGLRCHRSACRSRWAVA